jgi:hypothetical protein
MAFRDVRFVHVNIVADPQAVAAYLADPWNMPRWAVNFGHEIHREGDGWVMQTPLGPFAVRMAPDNDLGVVDHWVKPLGGGEEVHSVLRVTENGVGTLVAFTLFRQDGFDDAQFDEDERLVSADLRRLKGLIEGES